MVTTSAESGTELCVGTRRAYWAWRGLAALGFAAACGWSLRAANGSTQLIGALGLPMFGSFAAYALRQGLRRGPRLRLTREGFDAADLGIGLVPWTQVEEVQAFGSDEAPFVLFLVPDAPRYLARMPWWPRFMAGWLRRSGLPMFSINLIGVEGSAWEVVARACALWRDARDRVED